MISCPAIRSALRPLGAASLVVISVFALYLLKPANIQVADAIWVPHIAASVLAERDPYLDEYRDWVEFWDFAAAVESNGKIESFFPLGGSLLILPQMVVFDFLYYQLDHHTLHEYLIAHSPIDPGVLRLQLINASLLVAISAGAVYLTSREYLTVAYAVILTATYAFATSAYSTASRAMWQHGPSMLMLSLTLLLLVKAKRRPKLIVFTGLTVAAAIIIRPTNIVSLGIVTIYVLAYYRKHFAGYVMCGLLLGLPFALVNLQLYGQWLPPYFAAGRLGSPNFLEALLGNIISPARGIFVFSPVLLLSLAGVGIKLFKRDLAPLDWAICLILVLHWLVISSFGHWWAGHSFGPRFFSDVLPYLAYFLIPVLYLIQSPNRKLTIRVLFGFIFAALMCLSIFIHYRGATSIATFGWNSIPSNVDLHPERLWQWDDLQFMRGLGRNLIAITPLQLIVEPETGSDAQKTFQIGRMADGPIDIFILLPGRVSLSHQTAQYFHMVDLPGGGQSGQFNEPLDSLGMRDIHLAVDTEKVAGSASLNAIQIVARRMAGMGARQEETHIIEMATAPNQDRTTARPHDIKVDCQPPGFGELYALFGAGWYDEEVTGDASWRWASTPTYLFVWSDIEQDVVMEIPISGLYDGEEEDGLGNEGILRIDLPNGATATVPVQTFQSARLEFPVQSGWNTLTLELEAGNFRPADLIPGHYETRLLSFSIDGIFLSGKCAGPPQQP